MPSSYSTNLRLELQATGENRSTWGIKANQVFTDVDNAIAGTVNVAMADANRTLSVSNGTSDESRYMCISLTGALTITRDVICPSVSKLYMVTNGTTGGQSVNFRTSAGGTQALVPNGATALVWCDGTTCILSGSTLIGTTSRNNTWTAENTFSAGIDFGSSFAAATNNLTNHISLYSTTYGFAPTSGFLNYNVPTGAVHQFLVNNVVVGSFTGSGLTLAAPLAIAQGGTASTTAAAARTALGADNAANLTTGTLPAARIGSGVDYSMNTLTLVGDILNFHDEGGDNITFNNTNSTFTFSATAGSTVIAGTFQNSGGVEVVFENRVITAGSGLTGGGALSANVTIDINMTAGGLGTYALARQTSGTARVIGDNIAGSNLQYASAAAGGGAGTPNGNWRCMGRITGDASTNNNTNITLWMRYE